MSDVSYASGNLVVDSTLDESMSYANTDDRARSHFGGNTHLSVRSGDFVREEGESRNIIQLLPGIHQGFSASKPFSHILGSPGSIVNRLATISSDATVSGLYFRQDEDESNLDRLVHVTGDSSVVFQNCVFQRKHNAPSAADPALPALPAITQCFVLIESSARAMFVGCVFRSDFSNGVMNGVGTVVQSLAPAAGNVYVGAGANFTTHTQGTTVTSFAPEIA